MLGVFDTVASLANPTAIVILAAVSALIIALLSLASFWLPGSYWAWLGILAGGSALIALLANLISRFKIAFGLPGVRWWRTLHFATARMKMYDTELDEHVRFARHAISIDEQRGSFERVPWGIPGQWKSGMPIWFEQVWFAGNHSDIGGSYAEDESRLSDIALDWMANAAVEVGLGVDHSVLRVTPDPRGRRKHAAASAGRRREPSHASRPPFTRLEGEVGSAMEKGSATPSCCRLAQTGTVVASLHTRGSTMNYYEILGVDRGAEQEVIDAAFRAMMRRYHPDTFTGPNAEADRRAKQLNEAYAVLRHPDRRHAYDATLGPVAPPSPPVFETLPNPGRSQPVNRAVMILAGTAAVGALVMVFYLNRPTAAVPVAPVAATDAAVLPAPPEPSPVLIPASTPSPTLFAACRGMACRVMTPFGWGGIEAGVTTDSAQQASAMKIRDDGHYTDAGDGTCLAYEVIGGPKNLQMLVESGVVTTVEAYLDPAGSVFRTDRGVKLGDPESDVRKAYKGLKQLPDIYSEPPDKKLFHYEPGGERGIKFSINGGKVTGISVGSRSIEYVEGCL